MDGAATSINSILKNIIKNFNTLLDCPVRFSGEYGGQKIHYFIEYIQHYKSVKCISDEQALQELQYLLHDHALNWWLRRKANANTWSVALVLLKNQFSKKRPANVVYREILNHSYDQYASKADFVDDQMELFSELAQAETKEENKLDLMYALLPSDILNKVTHIKTHVVKGLKEQLCLIQLNEEDNRQSIEKLATNANGSLQVNENNKVGNEVNETLTNSEPSTSTENNSINRENCVGNSVIKMERTENAMPPDVKTEQAITSNNEGLMPPDAKNEQAIISNDDDPMPLEMKNEQDFIVTDSDLDKTNDNFQIDSDIMNQINNIIDESEMNTDALIDKHHIPTVSPQPINSFSSLELLGFHLEATIHPETISKKSPPLQQQNEKIASPTKKQRMRCSYCRLRSHTIQTCSKKARHLKLFPEKHFQRKPPDNLAVCDRTIAASKPAIESSTEVLSVLGIPTVTTSATTTIPTTDVNNTAAVIVNNPIEKITNPSLTTKLIAPINGPMSSKLLAAKLRNATTPSPKCHQCGNVGFYKSICPNCSPIYNNNSNNMQYNK